jgi:hypothetical protein
VLDIDNTLLHCTLDPAIVAQYGGAPDPFPVFGAAKQRQNQQLSPSAAVAGRAGGRAKKRERPAEGGSGSDCGSSDACSSRPGGGCAQPQFLPFGIAEPTNAHSGRRRGTSSRGGMAWGHGREGCRAGLLSLRPGLVDFMRTLRASGRFVFVAYTHGSAAYAAAVVAQLELLLAKGGQEGSNDTSDDPPGSEEPYFGAGQRRVISRDSPAHRGAAKAAASKQGIHFRGKHAGELTMGAAQAAVGRRSGAEPDMYSATLGLKTLAAVTALLQAEEPALLEYLQQLQSASQFPSSASSASQSRVRQRQTDSSALSSVADAAIVVDDSSVAWENAVRTSNLVHVPAYTFGGFVAGMKGGSFSSPSAAEAAAEGAEVLTHSRDEDLPNLLQLLLELGSGRARALGIDTDGVVRSSGSGAGVGAQVGATADIRHVLRARRMRVLLGCRIVFSSIVPRGKAPDSVAVVRDAMLFGATCLADLDEGDASATDARIAATHVVGNKVGTDKTIRGEQLGRHVVSLAWLIESIRTFKRQPEANFPLRSTEDSQRKRVKRQQQAQQRAGQALRSVARRRSPRSSGVSMKRSSTSDLPDLHFG